MAGLAHALALITQPIAPGARTARHAAELTGALRLRLSRSDHAPQRGVLASLSLDLGLVLASSSPV